jgi:hypothetical protein
VGWDEDNREDGGTRPVEPRHLLHDPVTEYLPAYDKVKFFTTVNQNVTTAGQHVPHAVNSGKEDFIGSSRSWSRCTVGASFGMTALS